MRLWFEGSCDYFNTVFDPDNAPLAFSPIDRVSGYNINQIENALQNATTWNTWKSNLKNNYNNSTEQYLDELFANWTN